MTSMKEYLQQRKLITDGSFGTFYAEKYATGEMPELANLRCPERVLQIHESYIRAGAKLLRTNTFAANTILLEQDMDKVKENIRAAVKIAKEAALKSTEEIFIAGDIGPIPEEGSREVWEIEEEYYELARTFLETGISVLSFETFSDIARILPAIQRVKKEYDVFIMVQFCVNQFGYTNMGLSAAKLLKKAGGFEEIDAIGLNCGIGPSHMKQLWKQIGKISNQYFIALPNAGYPKRARNKLQFINNPEYFSKSLLDMAEWGIDIMGGCCGTNPAFIKQLSEIVGNVQQPQNREYRVETSSEKEIKKNGFFYEEDGTVKAKKLIAVELAPPFDAKDETVLEAAYRLKESGVDILTFPDSPSGRTRVDSVLMAEKVKQETGLLVMPHICCRDRNAIAMRSMLLGAHINGIRNLLIITGDPIQSMVRQTVKAVFNFESVGLMNIVKDMNEDIFSESPMAYGGAINQGRRNLEVEIGRVRQKMEAGAEFFLTQPVFSKEDANRVRKIKEETGARILCGIMPLVSRKNALFMMNEIAGVPVTEELIERYPEHATKEEGEAIGVEVAKEMMAYTESFVDGYYFSFPFNRVYLLEKILKTQ
ncbi:MAG: bifunctional homocysteine S-methyltransferase/methylenetetrahydrofolate reductase [Lachnospiraceae bacterium]|nr:bifunctional homocysteine S-methyltransferase/methylenetetrahydrofolate reductase [Lachnospiraceae bacterium]